MSEDQQQAKIEVADAQELKDLMDEAAYKKFTESGRGKISGDVRKDMTTSRAGERTCGPEASDLDR